MQVFNLSMSAVAGVGVGVGGGIREYGNKTRQRQTAVSPYLSCAELKISLFAWDQVGFRPQPRSGRGSPGLTRSDRVEAKGACPEYEPWTLIWASVWVTQPWPRVGALWSKTRTRNEPGPSQHQQSCQHIRNRANQDSVFSVFITLDH